MIVSVIRQPMSRRSVRPGRKGRKLQKKTGSDTYALEFASLIAVFAVLVVSPGADFSLVVRKSMVHSALHCHHHQSIGIDVLLLFRINYTIPSIELIVLELLFLFAMLKWSGAAYLAYISIQSLCARGIEVDAAQLHAGS